MTENGKRKDAPTGGVAQERSKKKKTGNGGKWKTPHQQAKLALHQDASLQPGDRGIWITCARHQEGKAAREIDVLFAEYAEKMYNIRSVHDTQAGEPGDGGGAEEDIEAAIRKEIAALTSGTSNTAAGSGAGGANLMKSMKMNVDCLLFVKTQPPVDPVAFVRRICEDAKSCNERPCLMRCRYVNRLTPVSFTGKATEQGIVEVARKALAPWFDLSGKRGVEAEESKAEPSEPAKSEEGQSAAQGDGSNVAIKSAADAKTEGGSNEMPTSEPEKKPFTFAIRPTIRNHSNLKRDVVINTIAGLINGDRHKVNLTSPDKVILVDVYQTVCGMSVVDGDWDELKRFNLTELYGQARNAQSAEISKHHD
ncbi:tRNA acetyltransferase TAN1 [Achaetomium macrosporum]|uniref:tRNA acetyltransferase TAN1 n=1 Tax=Achaetomium macrosporum TaxID=79813 RepID=A0AAN7H679_9PEZI|nr:tRNA acetyltransferase TAN1 [Achaetomium macrosporum]